MVEGQWVTVFSGGRASSKFLCIFPCDWLQTCRCRAPKTEAMWPFGCEKNAYGFSSISTAEEVTAGIDGCSLTAIVTGATSGIGKETARVLALRGVHVILAVRNTSKGREVKEEILKSMAPSSAAAPRLDVMEIDVSSLASVRGFVKEFLSRDLPLNILINNAGINGNPFSLSSDGIELQFATNYLGHFLLTYLLLENMKDTCTKSMYRGRIINVSSTMHNVTYPGGIRFKKLNSNSWYNTFLSYGQSKLANILHSNHLSSLFEKEKVNLSANSVHPGCISTNIVSNNYLYYVAFNMFVRLMGKSVEQGAATTCFMALHPKVESMTGRYIKDCNITKPSGWGQNEELARELWDFSMKLTNVNNLEIEKK